MSAAPAAERRPPVAAAAGPAAAGDDRRGGRALWLGALAVLLLGALALRVWGVQTGLPFVYNPDENAHFVPRAIGMFGHTLNPGYFINPPAYTYLLHAVLWLRFGGREAVGASFAADPTEVFTLARLLSGLSGTLAVGFLAWAGARLFDRTTGLVAGVLAAVAFLPVHYGHFALNDVPTLAPLCLCAGRHRRGPAHRAPARLRARRGGARGGVRDQVHGGHRAALAAGGGRRGERPGGRRAGRAAARAGARRRARAGRLPGRQPVRAVRLRHLPRGPGEAVRGLLRRRGQARASPRTTASSTTCRR